MPDNDDDLTLEQLRDKLTEAEAKIKQLEARLPRPSADGGVRLSVPPAKDFEAIREGIKRRTSIGAGT